MARVIGGGCGEHSLCGVAAQGGAMWFNTLVVWIVLFQRVQAAVYLNKWAVEILGGPDVANQVATDYGFRNLGQVSIAGVKLVGMFGCNFVAANYCQSVSQSVIHSVYH